MNRGIRIKVLNQFINFFWSIICFTPVFVYWADDVSLYWLYAFIAISLLTVFFPLRIFQMSSNYGFYERIGVRQIRKFVQNGDLINKALRRKDPAYKVSGGNYKAYLHTVKMYEKYHLICFVFFTLSGIHALLSQRIVLALLIFTANVVYNLCPIVLQQYNRIRVLRLIK